MKDYELLYVVSGDKSEEDATKVIDQVNSVLMNLGGKSSDENVWGRRKLAYPIAKEEHGWYVVTQISLEPTKVNEFQQTLRLNTDILRVMIVQASEIPTPEEAERIQAGVQEREQQAEDKKAQTKPAKAEPEPEAKKAPRPEAPEQTEERQAKLEEKLDEILKEE